jgi:hypothetical protein
VLGIDEYLAKYRVHDANSYRQSEGKVSDTQLKNRMKMRDALVAEIRDWLRKHGLDTESGNIHDYLVQWRKAQERDGFALQTPGRWEFYRHLVEYPQLYSVLMSKRQRAHSYLRAFAGLALGYRHLHLFDDMYAGFKGWRKSQATVPGEEIPPR